jgi:4'-phosphopantetheinyl transferase
MMGSENPVFLLKPRKAHFWLFDLDDQGHNIQTWDRFLSTEEITRSKQFHFDQDRLRFITRRGILRHLLAAYTGMKPAEVGYQTDPNGKLFLPSHPLKFNLSCSQNRAAFAFTLQDQVGVDLEQVRSFPEIDRLAERWFSADERTSLAGLAPEMQMDAFFHIWTQKKAFIKAQGGGLSFPLHGFSVSVNPHQPGGLHSIMVDAESVSCWKIYTHVPLTGWRAAVCVRSNTQVEITWNMAETTWMV